MRNFASFCKLKRSALLAIIAVLTFGVPFGVIFAQTMQSGSYKIISDSVNVGGSDTSSSTNYKIGDTLGELGTGDSSSATYFMHAGFWQMQSSYISITSPSDLALASIGGISGDNTEGTLSWDVLTDNATGYSLNIKTLTIPALASPEDSFADYTPAGADPDYDFSIASTESAFGFSPEGTDVNARFKDNGVACNTGSGETSGKCWDGLSLADQTIAGSTSSNHPSGTTTTVRFHAESGSAHIQTAGSYSASIVVTAVTL